MEEKTISSQVFTKNGKFEITKKESSRNEKGSYIYTFYIKCVNCGSEKTTSGSHLERCICNNCRKESTNDKYIGQITGCYKVLSFSHYGESKTQTRYFNVQCINCNTISVKSLKTILTTTEHCSNCEIKKRKTPTLDAPRNCVKSSYVSGAVDRGYIFNLSDEKFDELIFGNCFYCGQEPEEYKSDLRLNKTNLPFKRNGIDRLNNSIGYTEENCVTSCSKCNRMKSDLDYLDFIQHINKIVNKGSTTISKESTIQVNGIGNRELPEKEGDIV
jgi:hypothetical protein